MVTRDEIIQVMRVRDGEGGFVEFTKEEAEFLSKATHAFSKAFPDRNGKLLKLLDPNRDRDVDDLPPDFVSWLEDLMRIGKSSSKVVDIKIRKKRGIEYTKNAPTVADFLESHPDLLKKVKGVAYLDLLADLAYRAEKEALNGDKGNDEP